MSCFSHRVSVIIPHWNGTQWLPGCLAGLRNQSMSDFEIIVLDNGSGDESVTFLRDHFPAVKVISFEKNAGFPVAVNSGIPKALREFIALLNNDCVPEKNIPGPLPIRHAGTLLIGQMYSFWVYKHPVSSMRAYLYLLFHFPDIIRQRSDILPGIVLSSEKKGSMLQRLPAGRSA